jgi:hypothetical protein
LKKLPVRREIGSIIGMEYLLDRKGERRLAAYFDRIGGVLRTTPFKVIATANTPM